MKSIVETHIHMYETGEGGLEGDRYLHVEDDRGIVIPDLVTELNAYYYNYAGNLRDASGKDKDGKGGSLGSKGSQNQGDGIDHEVKYSPLGGFIFRKEKEKYERAERARQQATNNAQKRADEAYYDSVQNTATPDTVFRQGNMQTLRQNGVDTSNLDPDILNALGYISDQAILITLSRGLKDGKTDWVADAIERAANNRGHSKEVRTALKEYAKEILNNQRYGTSGTAPANSGHTQGSEYVPASQQEELNKSKEKWDSPSIWNGFGLFANRKK